MALNNPDGFDNFTNVQGTHIGTYSDENVWTVLIFLGKSPIIPSVICQQFKFLNHIAVLGRGLEKLTEKALADCYFLESLGIEDSVVEFHPNSLENNPFLGSIWISSTNIQTLPEALLQKNSMLNWISIFGNKHLRELPANFFKNTTRAEVVSVMANDLQVWHAEWFQSMPLLKELTLSHNFISEIPPFALNSSRLTSLRISSNLIRNISRQSLGDISNLNNFQMNFNFVGRVDKEVFKDAKKLNILGIESNMCADITIFNLAFYLERAIQELKDCFGPIIGGDGGKNY